MGASKDFEYKIHLSVSADDFTPDIQKIFKNAQQQADKNQVKLTLTGDDTDLVKQLASLKSKLPKIDLQNSINVGLSDALKADTERAQQYTDTFLTNIINKVNETLNTISFLESEIDKTQKALDSKIKIRDKDLGAGDASKALDNLIEKFKKITVDPKNIDKLKDTYQKITDISSSTGKNVGDSIKNTVENIKTSLGDIFKDIKPSKTYEEYMENISSEVFGLENKLVNLNKQLESAKSPDLKVKGKLTDDFLPDLQNQLDSLTGLEVKVKPVVDKDVKLEVEAEIKPVNGNSNSTAMPIDTSSMDKVEQELVNVEEQAQADVTALNKLAEAKSKLKSEFADAYNDETLDINWSEDEVGTLDRIANRLKEIYQYRNEDNFEQKYGNEVVALMDIAEGAGYGNFIDDEGVNHLSKNIQKYLNNVNRFVEARQTLKDLGGLNGVLYEESDGQLSLFEKEAAVKREDAEATKELAEAESQRTNSVATPGQITIDGYNDSLKNTQQQAESTAESLDKIDQELNDDISSSGLDSIDSDIQDIGNSSEKSSQEVSELKDAIKDLGNADIGALDIDRVTSYGVDKEGNEVSNSIYKVKGENITGVLDEEMNVMRTTTSVAKGYTQAQQEMADQAEATAQVEAELTRQLDLQANKWKAFESEQKKYESTMNKAAVQSYKEQWGELSDKVKEYIKYREEVAKSGKLDTDQSVSSKIEEMENSIYRMTDALIDNPLYNQSFETKALSGLDSIEQKIQSIRFDKIISNYKQLSSLQLEKYNLTTKGVPENNGYVEYLNSRISKINEETEALRTLEYTEEQLTAIRDAEVSSLKSVEKQQSVNSATAKKYEQTLESTRAALQKQAASLTSNGKLMKVYGDQVNALIEEIKNPSTTLERLNQIRNELNKISAEAVAAGKSGKSLFQILQQRAQSLVAYLSTFASFYRVVSYVRQAFSTITDLDTQLVDLRKTTSMTTSELNEFYNSSSDVAKELGTTTSQIISQAAAWSRLGYSTKEASTEMAKLSSQFAAISPGMTTDESTDYLVSTMQAYGIAVDEVERKVMDNVNRIGNTFATTNAEIGEMLTRSSAAMHAANNSLEETIALESAAVEITRNAETTGTAFRTISMRIRGKQSLPPYSENYMLCA